MLYCDCRSSETTTPIKCWHSSLRIRFSTCSSVHRAALHHTALTTVVSEPIAQSNSPGATWNRHIASFQHRSRRPSALVLALLVDGRRIPLFRYPVARKLADQNRCPFRLEAQSRTREHRLSSGADFGLLSGVQLSLSCTHQSIATS